MVKANTVNLSMIDFDAVEHKLDNEDSSSRGGHCYFYDLGNSWGIKAYYKICGCDGGQYYRDIGWRCQKEAAEHGLAPEVGIKFQIGNWYCYVTEVVEPYIPYDLAREEQQSQLGLSKVHDICHSDKYIELESQFFDMCERKLGHEYHDAWAGQFGWKNGEFVCIDWDREFELYRRLVGLE